MSNNAHLLPFLWLHGEDDETLIRGVEQIKASGCDMFCAESRTHPEFLGKDWWREMGVLLDASRRLGMKFYLLDDTHFPSGFANGAGADTPFQRMLMNEKHIDIAGPRKGGRLVIWPDGFKQLPAAVVAGRKLDKNDRVESFVDLGGYAVDSLVDLTDRVEDGLLDWDVPDGVWRVFILSAEYVSERNPPQKFLNPLLPESGQMMLSTVYEPHYRFFGDECGKTFLGFFSDEPALRAGRGSHAVLGEYPGLPVPWRQDLPELLSAKLGENARRLLPGLWFDIGEKTPFIRYAFMDEVSALYAQNYSMPIGSWCRARGLEYIGHVIEQNNAHSRLGQGAGHFFRAISGQTMAGMDFVLHELRPEFYGGYHAWHSQSFEAEDDFFRFMLPQMTASAAALDPNKGGRALCECFGAYGWQEDIGEMRYIANLLLSRGINYFTPHAFSLKPAPDPDSPPHFAVYPPYDPYIRRLFDSMERAAKLIDGGRHVSPTGVLYYAEAEWACGSSVMKTQRIVRELNEHQLACEVVPIELLEAGRYQALLIPAAERWPKQLFSKLEELENSGCHVAFVDRKPTGYADCDGAPGEGYECVRLNEAAKWCAQRVKPSVVPAEHAPMVHVYPYDSRLGRLYLLFNEDSRKSTRFTGVFEGLDAPVLYDPEEDECAPADGEKLFGAFKLALTLEPGQLLALSDPLPGWPEAEARMEYRAGREISPLWRVSFPDDPEMESFETNAPEDLFKRYPRFAGRARYEAEILTDRPVHGFEIPEIYGAATLYVDGVKAGDRVCAPYRFVTELPAGRHALTLDTVNCPAYRWRDPLSAHGWLPPVGLTGRLRLLEG
ncbi:MAG: hypothetical protein K5663_12485 [Clostridiales bacterium]|nr:hypothetical protein [Clostridiales bacterium]